MKKRMRLSYLYVFAGSVVVLLGGCLPGAQKEEIDKNDVVLLKINKKPVITKSEFYKELGGMIGNMDPSLLPKETQRKVLDDLSKFKLIVQAAEKEGVKNDPEYKKAYNQQKNRLKELLMSRIYEKKMFDNIAVSDAEVMADYEANKTRYIKQPGGSLVVGVSFADKEKALSFYDSVKGRIAEFDSLAKKEKDGRFREFGRVAAEQQSAEYGSMVPPSVREAALNLSKLPAVDVVKDKKETWVICVSDKKEAEMYALEEIEDRIKNQIKVNKFMDVRNKKHEELKNSFDIEVNEEFFKSQEATAVENEIEEESTEDTTGENL